MREREYALAKLLALDSTDISFFSVSNNLKEEIFFLVCVYVSDYVYVQIIMKVWIHERIFFLYDL